MKKGVGDYVNGSTRSRSNLLQEEEKKYIIFNIM